MDVDEQLHAIAMTASAMQEDRDGCQAEGMDDYVSKPIRAVEVNLPLKLTHKNGRRRQPIPRREV